MSLAEFVSLTERESAGSRSGGRCAGVKARRRDDSVVFAGGQAQGLEQPTDVICEQKLGNAKGPAQP